MSTLSIREYNPNLSSHKPTIALPLLDPDLTKAKQSPIHQPKLNFYIKKGKHGNGPFRQIISARLQRITGPPDSVFYATGQVYQVLILYPPDLVNPF